MVSITKLNLILITVPYFCLSSVCTHAFAKEKEVDKPAHHTENGFQNPYIASRKRGLFKFMKMRFFGDEKFADYESNAYKIPRKKTDLGLIENPPSVLQATWIGHATVLLQYRGINILTDPIFSARSSPLSFIGPRRHNQPSVNLKDLPPIDYVLISHSHYDHLDKKTVQHIGSKTQWLVPLGLRKWFVRAGIKKENVMEFDWWDEKRIKNIMITATPAQHWSSRSLWDRSNTLWASWMLQIDDKIIWYSGDTGYNPFQFKEIGRKFNKVDLALISIGAYEPRWFMKDMHINPEEAVQIHQDIGSQYSIALHWGTFQLSAEPIDGPPLKLKSALTQKGIPAEKFEILDIGETRQVK